jgi:hypothetical protein
VFKAGSTLAANSRGIKRLLTPTKKTRLAAWCAYPLRQDAFFCRVLPQAYQAGLILRGDRSVFPQVSGSTPAASVRSTRGKT